MKTAIVTRRNSTNWDARMGGILISLALLLVLSFAAPLPNVSSSATPRVQPVLLQMAAAQPDATISVIVQKSVKDNRVEELVAQLGGTVTQDLSIINAFAAELPAGAVQQLALANGVKWVSLDAPTKSSSISALDVRVSANSDDAEEEGLDGVNLGPGGMYLTSTDLELMRDLDAPSSGTQLIGLRFNGISIPRGATITNAYLRFTAIAPDAGNSNTSTGVYTIQAQAVDNATTFTAARNNLSTRPRTTAAVQWTPSAWTAGTVYDSPNLTPIVKEINSRPGWTSGNSMVFVFRCMDGMPSTYCGSRSAASWDGSPANAPLLHIEWDNAVSPSPSPTPIATPSPTPTTAPLSTSPNTFVTWANQSGTAIPMGIPNSSAMFDSALGPNGTYSLVNRQIGSFGGLTAEVTPGRAITKVEAVLYAYVPQELGHDFKLIVYKGGQKIKDYTVSHSNWNTYIGIANVKPFYLDITSTRWIWGDFDNNVEIALDHNRLDADEFIYYDAIGLRVTTAPGTDTTGGSGGDTSALTTIDTSKQVNVFNQVIGASNLWNTNTKIQGKGVTVAVVDSGLFKTKDIDKRVRKNVNFNAAFHDGADRFGHGTFVAGIIAGSGSQSSHKYIGVAPRVDLLGVRVSNDQGVSTESDVIAALQWVLTNQDKYKIRVVNLSLNSRMMQSYQTSPLDAAVEILWFNGIVVVVSAGNNGTAALYPPANDPFVITVGSTDDKGTVDKSDDVMASFSAYGTTESGFAKPDLVTPGKAIIGLLPENDKLRMGINHPANRIDQTYFKMSGTSVSAPMVTGAVALLLQDEPNLTPDQVKYRLKATANKSWPGYTAQKAGAGYLDIFAAVYGTSTARDNSRIAPSRLLTTGITPLAWNSVNWDSVNWDSVNWDSVNWDSVNWDSVNWDSVNWDSDYWGP